MHMNAPHEAKKKELHVDRLHRAITRSRMLFRLHVVLLIYVHVRSSFSVKREPLAPLPGSYVKMSQSLASSLGFISFSPPFPFPLLPPTNIGHRAPHPHSLRYDRTPYLLSVPSDMRTQTLKADQYGSSFSHERSSPSHWPQASCCRARRAFSRASAIIWALRSRSSSSFRRS